MKDMSLVRLSVFTFVLTVAWTLIGEIAAVKTLLEETRIGSVMSFAVWMGCAALLIDLCAACDGLSPVILPIFGFAPRIASPELPVRPRVLTLPKNVRRR